MHLLTKMRKVRDTVVMWLVLAGDILVCSLEGRLGIIHSGDTGLSCNPDLREATSSSPSAMNIGNYLSLSECQCHHL